MWSVRPVHLQLNAPPQVIWWSAYRLMLPLMEHPVGVRRWGVSNSLAPHLNLLKTSYKPTGGESEREGGGRNIQPANRRQWRMAISVSSHQSLAHFALSEAETYSFSFSLNLSVIWLHWLLLERLTEAHSKVEDFFFHPDIFQHETYTYLNLNQGKLYERKVLWELLPLWNSKCAHYSHLWWR